MEKRTGGADPRAGTLVNMRLVRLGGIFTNVSTALTVFSAVTLLSFFVVVIMALVLLMIWLCATVFTFGLVYIAYPDFAPGLLNLTDVILGGGTAAIMWLNAVRPYLTGIAALLGAGAIVIHATDKCRAHVGMIVFNSIVTGVAVLLFIISLTAGDFA